ncbi:leucine-rich repeat protein, partial [Breznakiellaceae bacterium SP9]
SPEDIGRGHGNKEHNAAPQCRGAVHLIKQRPPCGNAEGGPPPPPPPPPPVSPRNFTEDGGSGQTDEPDAPNRSPAVQPSNPYFSGDGRNDMSLTILVPDSHGIDNDHAYLPLMIQNCLVANISKYSAIKVLDSVALDKVIAETLDPTYKDNLDIVRLGNVTQTGYIMTGDLIKTSYGYTLTINVTDTTPNPQTIAYSGNCTVSQLDDQSVIQLASKELLAKMNVNLSDRAIAELSSANQQSIYTQTNLAKGRYAQLQGFEIEALTYYLQVAKFDPSLPEAISRSEVLAANISSGRIGNDLRNDVQWRKDWIARLAETEQQVKKYNDYYYKYYSDYYNDFYKKYNAGWDALVSQENEILNKRSAFISSLPAPPYTLYYTIDVRNSGVIDYKTETTGFTGIKALLRVASPDWKQSIEKAVQTLNDSERDMQKAEQDLQGKIAEVQRMVQAEQTAMEAAIQEVVQAVNDGLKATGRQDVWLLAPLNVRLTNAQFNRSLLKTAKPNVPPIHKSGSVSFSVSVELVNGRNKVIGTNTFRTSGTYSITNTGASVSDDVWSTVDFANVNVNDITDDLTIRIAGVNGKPAASASRSDGLQIQVVNLAEWNSVLRLWDYTIQEGQITQYKGKGGSVTIPHIIWVTSIGDNAFANKQLTSITIPDSVTSIGGEAFRGNQLTSVVIPNSVTSIGDGAFYNNQLTSVVIPNSVTSIGDGAFSSNQLTSVVIPNSVTSIGDWAFYNNPLRGQTIPSSVTSLGHYAFGGDVYIGGALIPGTVTSIGDKAFYNKGLFGSVVIPYGITSIGESAFSSNRLTGVVIPNSVTSIEKGVFYNNRLTSVVIPNSVTSIGEEAFAYNQLTSVVIGANVRVGGIGDYPFSNGFEQYYERYDKKAGTYTRPNVGSTEWSFSPQQRKW